MSTNVTAEAQALFRSAIGQSSHPIWDAQSWTVDQIDALMCEDELHPDDPSCAERLRRMKKAQSLDAKRAVMQADLKRRYEWLTWLSEVYASGVPYDELPDFHRQAVDNFAGLFGPYPGSGG